MNVSAYIAWILGGVLAIVIVYFTFIKKYPPGQSSTSPGPGGKDNP